MEKITIKHIGPVEFVDIELNKINVIMGPQGSGKSTIWEVEEGKGTLKSIKDPTTGTVNKHYFNKIMNSLLDEYYAMLNHYQIQVELSAQNA